jgi:Peptidase A4 family
MDRQALLGASAGVALVAMLGVAHAQNAPVTPTNVPGIGVVAPPPPGFDAVNASPAVRALYAVPPAPDPVAAPDAYAHWKAAVSAPQNRETPVLEQTNISNGPARGVGSLVPQGNANVATTSNNWSGTAYSNSSNPFTVEAIEGIFVVPTAHQAFGSCTGGWDYSSQWVGIDGWGSPDVLQAGTEVDAYCSGSTNSSLYSAWIEWFPFNETRVSSPAIHPGDEVFVEVWSTSPTNGYAYIYNYSTLQTATYNLTPPSGTRLQGNSVEWIVERTSINNVPATLTNYIDSSWPLGAAWNYTNGSPTYCWEGSSSSSACGTFLDITMLDNSGSGISAATIENYNFLYFQDFGSACGRSGAPPC